MRHPSARMTLVYRNEMGCFSCRPTVPDTPFAQQLRFWWVLGLPFSQLLRIWWVGVPPLVGLGPVAWGVVRSLLRLFAVVLVAAIGTAAIGAAATPEISNIATAFDSEAGQLPPLIELSQSSVVFDAFGSPIDELRVENRESLKFADMPQTVIDAVLATEDASFYEHKGVSARGVARAALNNLDETANPQGGSTITQQLIKNALVGSARDANRKLLEASYAIRLEREWTKNEILERYLNTVYFGNNAYGLQSAALTYFGKPAAELDLYQAGFLAGLIRNPVGFDPISRSELAKRRFDEVIDRLVDVERITQDEGALHKKTFVIPPRLLQSVTPPKATNFFTAEVRQQLLNRTAILGADYQERYQKLFRGGLRIYTTYDPNIQAQAERARDEQLPSTGGRFQAAIVTLDTNSGAVRAMVGGDDFKTSEVNLALTPRQTGSSVKGFITAAAINSGIQNNDFIDGTLPCTWTFPDKSQPDYKVDDGVSKPTGTIEQMTWDSINCAYVRMYLAVGGPRVIETMKQLGVRSEFQDIFSFAVGGNEISPLRMAVGYASIANQGLKHEPYYIDRIEDRSGRVLFQRQDDGVQVLDPGVANRTVDILKGVIRQGTATRARLANGRPAAGKTGTYDKNKHSWFIGFTPQYTTAVYMGNPRDPNDQMNGVPQYKQFYSVQGGTYPSLIWKQLMDSIHETFPVEDWPKPPNNPRQPARVYAPGQDCFATYVRGAPVEGDEEPPPVVLQRTTAKTTPLASDATDLVGPSATVPNYLATYSCAKGIPAAPRPVTPVSAVTTAKPGSSSTPATTSGSGSTTTTKPTAVKPTTTVKAGTTTKP